MKTEILLFLSQFATVFLLGIQSQNVFRGQFVGASITSIFIGSFQCLMWKKMPESTPSQMVAWLLAGPLAIVCAMWLHPRMFKKKFVVATLPPDKFVMPIFFKKSVDK